MTKLCSRFKSMAIWAWRHKLRCVGGTLGTLVVAYAGVFMLVSCATSPTDQRVNAMGRPGLAYQVFPGAGDAGRLILVHGAPADATSWGKLIRKQSSTLPFAEIVAVDRLGYGNSPKGAEVTLAGHAASLAPLLKEVNGGKPVLVGHSYGGPVVLRVAADYHDQVGGIVLVAGATDPNMKDAQWFRKSVNGVSGVVPEPWVVANRELLALTDENRAMQPLLKQVTCPVVVIHGQWDAVCPHDGTVAYLRENLPNAQVTVVSLERVGHNIHLSHPHLVAEHAGNLQAKR